LEDRLRPVPEGIGVETFIKDLKVVFENENDKTYRNGDHVIILGTEENIKNWLKPHSPICVGIGPLMMQNFEIKDVA
jgi:hypothetical protein